MNTQEIKRDVRLANWANIVKERTQSGLSVEEYCFQNGITKNMYYYRLRQVRKSAINTPSGRFVELAIPNDTHCSDLSSLKNDFSEQMVMQIKDIRFYIADSTPISLIEKMIQVARNVK